MDQTQARKVLQELIKDEGLNNKRCIDCSSLSPQWASVSFAVFMCLQCAGTHRGFGVHISFVRSISMDTWQDDQIRRMKLGGNTTFRKFLKEYSPAEQGGYHEDMSIHGKYHCWAAAQYKEKLSAGLEGKPWSPSAPPSDFDSSMGTEMTSRPSSAQDLRKLRASGRSSASPPPRSGLTNSANMSASPDSRKSNNEEYFANLGAINASRSANLPPSQGGRYQGFGNTTSASSSSQHPSYGISSAAVPSLYDLRENPAGALSRGWSLFSSAVIGASRAVSETVIQPGMERVRDPAFQSSIKSYVEGAGKRVTAASTTANQWGKQRFGVDVAESVGGIVDNVKERVAGPGHVGYGTLATSGEDGDEWGEFYDAKENFEEQTSIVEHSATGSSVSPRTSSSAVVSQRKNVSLESQLGRKHDDWDEWKDF